MNSSFYNGVSGVKTHQFGLDVWANNISNISTLGFRGLNPEFSSVFSTTLAEGNSNFIASDKGLGSMSQTTALDLTQGILENTDNPFDLAISGEGWFGVQGQGGQIYYTRSGEYGLDASGNLVDKSGNYLLATPGNNITPTTLEQEKLDQFGTYYDPVTSRSASPYAISLLGDVPLGSVGEQTKVTLPDYLYFPPEATTKVSYGANLDPTISYDIDGNEIANVEHFTTSIISPTGDKNILDMTFTKQVPQPVEGSLWDSEVKILSYYEDYTVEQYDPTKTYDTSMYTIDTTEGTVTKTYDPAQYYVNTSDNKVYEIIDSQTGVVSFGSAGQLLSNTIPTLSNGGTSMSLSLGEPNSFLGLISSTTIDKSNVVSSNGYVEGFLTNYGMDGYGNVIAEFSNGRSSAVAKVVLYHFQNDQGLTQASSTYFTTSSNSGEPIFYTKENGESFLGSQIYSSKLEGSNVSYATALTELIVMQKAFDASAKSITTSDQLIQNAINMKKSLLFTCKNME